MTNNTKIAFGTSLTWDGEVVAGLTAINGIEISVDMVDITTHQSADAYKEFAPGLIDAGEVTIEGFFDYTDTAGQHAMLTDMNARAAKTGIITFPVATGTTWTFSGYITALKIGDAGTAEGIPFSATIKPTGKPTFAVAASNNVTALTITTATLYPTFAQGTYVYVGTCAAASLTMTPTFAAGTCTIYNGTTTITTLSTVASAAIALGANGSETDITMTIQEANKAPKVYTFRIARTA